MTPLLYVTSFNSLLFEKTGKKLVSTFLEHDCDGDLLICYEEALEKLIKEKYKKRTNLDKLLFYDLNEDEWLKSWTKTFAKHIPYKYGGVQRPDLLVNLPQIPPERLKKVLFFRTQTARWFRKIVSLNYAVKYHSYAQHYKYIIFSDCDIVFHQKLDFDFIDSICNNKAVTFHMGGEREKVGNGIESGFIIFNMDSGGWQFLEKTFELYESGEFLKELRWDDAYIFWKIKQKLPLYSYLDLVPKNQPIINGHVIEHGPFKPYLTHFKGTHKEIIQL
jgi:hypothetical protein